MTKPIPELTPEQQAHFWSHVDVRGTDECWPWLGAKHNRGYGIIRIGKMYRAHRVSIAIDGRDTFGLDALHSCDNPPCVNPNHLWAGTHADNMADMYAKGRATHISGDSHYSRTNPERLARGSLHGCAKLNENDVIAIRKDTRTNPVIAASYGVETSTIGKIKRRVIWRHVA